MLSSYRWMYVFFHCCVQLSFAQFNLYPSGLDIDKLSAAMNVSSDCVVALNQTIDECDQTLFQMASNFDNYWWQDDNITTLCSGNCSSNAALWLDDMSDPCYEEYITAYGKSVPISSVALRYTDGLNIVCLPSWTEDDPVHPWCLTESQDWVGSDIVRADCSVSPSDPTCGGNASAIPSENMRMANLYDDTILCDGCFVGLLYYRVTSIFLANSDHSDYLIDQLQDIQDVCNITVPEVTIRNIGPYSPAPTTISVATATTAPPTASTCAGQTISSASSSSCNSLSTTFGVTTGDLQTLIGNVECEITNAVCLPSACTLQLVGIGQTCDSIAAILSITTVQFLSWNRNVMGLCDSLTVGQYICGSAPGTNNSYALPTPPLGTAADAGNQQRGGAGGVVTPTSTATSVANSVSGFSVPSPTQDGLVTGCNNFALAKIGDDCFDFAASHSIPTTALYAWNPALGLNGVDCSTRFWASEYYCVGVAATATTPATAPGPTLTGVISSCNLYAQAISGDGCDVFASRNSISNAQLFAWNAVLGSSGENCLTAFFNQEWYCVGIAASVPPLTTSAPTTTSITAPGPTQTGIISNCNAYAEAIPGDSCDVFATRNSISSTNLFLWNAVLGNAGQNCGTSLFADEWYCVGVPSPTVTAPGPTQTGIVSNCNAYAEAVAGDSCSAFATRNNISNANLFLWNAVLGTAGQNCGTLLFANEWYCIGASSHVTAAGPTQTGIAKGCNRFAATVAGDSCTDFAAREGITPANLYAWNTVLGVNGANCATALFAQEYYCVGVSS